MSSRISSLMVEVGANVSGFLTAMGQVKAGLTSVANSAKSTNNVLGGSGDRIDQFNAKARALNDAYATGAMSQAEYTRQAKALGWSVMSNSEKFDIIKQRAQDAVRGFTTFSASAAIAGIAGKKAFDFAKSGAEIDYTTVKFDRLARSVGSTGDVFLNELRSATRGTVSDFGLLKQGSDLLQLGLAADTKEAVRLSSVMTALGMDTGELTLALANQSKRRLDQLGLSLTKFNEIESRLKDTGLTKEQAFKEAFMQTAEQTVMVTGNRADSGMGDMLRFEAEMANTWDQMKQMFVQSTPMLFGNQSISDTMGQVANTVQGLRMLMSGQSKWDYTGWNSETNQFGFDVVPTSPPDLAQSAMAQWTQNMAPIAAHRTGAVNLPVAAGNTADQYLYEDAATRRANANAYVPSGGGGGGGSGATMTPEDYALILTSGLDLTSMQRQFSDATADLNMKLGEENEKLDELTRKYGESSSKVDEQKEKISELQRGYAELNESQNTAMQSMALGMIQSKDETGQMSLEFSRASGLMSEDAYEAQSAIQKLTDAFVSGQISAEDAAKGIGKVGEWSSELDGKHVAMVVDVYIVQHGTIPGSSYKPKDIAGGSCFTGNTLITMADGKHKAIKNVSVGDIVKSYDVERNVFVGGLVVDTFIHESASHLNIDGLHVTPEHIVWSVTALDWIAAGELHTGDEFLSDTGERKRIESIQMVVEDALVYNFEVADVHTYFAGGVLVHNAKSNNMWTGGPFSDDKPTVVGDAPGGIWTPNTEVIWGGYVFNAKEARALKAAGLLSDASYMAGGGRAGQGGNRHAGKGRPGGNLSPSNGQRRNIGRVNRVGGDPVINGLGTADSEAAMVAESAANTAAMVISTQQNTQENAQMQTQQQVAATQESSAAVVEKLDEIGRILKRQPTSEDMYALFHSGQQTSI